MTTDRIFPSGFAHNLAPAALVMASAAVALAAYLQALHYPFILDDLGYIPWNTKLAGLHATELWRLFTEPYNGYFEFLPLRDLSYWLDIALFGQNPAALRLHNILLYLLGLPLLYATTLRLWLYFRPLESSGAPYAAAVVTSLFALHPALVETVIWISDRKYVLANLFSLLAFWFAVSARREHDLSSPHAGAAMVAYAAAMLSKTSYVTVAPLIALLWIIFWKNTPKQERRRSMILWPVGTLLLTASMTLIFIASGKEYISMSGGVAPTFDAEMIPRSLAVLGWIARLAISGGSRHMYYPVIEDPHLFAMIALGVAVLTVAIAGLVMLLRKPSLEGYALAAFFLVCMPYLQMIPYAPPSLASDRFLSLAAWPFILLIATLAWRLKPLLRTLLLVIIAVSWSFQTIDRPRDWRNFETLIDADLRSYPGYYMPAIFKITNFQLPRGEFQQATRLANGITNLEIRGIMNEIIKVHIEDEKDEVAAGKLPEAMAHLWKLRQDIKRLPDQARIDTPLNNLWVRLPYMLAVEWKYLVQRFPNDVSLRYNAGLWMLDARRYNDAVSYLRSATESPSLPNRLRGKAYASLGIALLEAGQLAEAEVALSASLGQSPPEPGAYCSLAEIYKQTERPVEAAQAEAACRSNGSD